MLLGTHSLVTLDPSGVRAPRCPSPSAQVRVIPQPFGSLFNLMMSETAELSDKRYVQEKIGVVDVGFRTTDYTVSDKTKYSGRGSGSSESGHRARLQR